MSRISKAIIDVGRNFRVSRLRNHLSQAKIGDRTAVLGPDFDTHFVETQPGAGMAAASVVEVAAGMVVD